MTKPVWGKSVHSADWFFLGRHFAKRKRSKPRIFVFKQSRQIQNWQPNSNTKYCHSLQRNYQKKLSKIETFPRFQWWMKTTNILRRVLLSWAPGNFWYRNWNRYHQKAIDDFINQQKIEILFWGRGGGAKRLLCLRWLRWLLLLDLTLFNTYLCPPGTLCQMQKEALLILILSNDV